MTDIAPSTVPIQQQSVQFNNPVSEASLSSIGGVANYLLNILAPVGTIWASMLNDDGDGSFTTNSFQAQLGFPDPATWVLADGRDVSGSQFQTLTGQTTVPDLRGISLRASNYGGSLAGARTDGFQNPDGTLSLGTLTGSRFTSHTHVMKIQNGENAFAGIGSMEAGYGGPGGTVNILPGALPIVAQNTGGNDTAPTNVTINYFIRIN